MDPNFCCADPPWHGIECNVTSRMRHFVFVVLLSLAFPLSAQAEPGKGYLAFAAKVQNGPTTAATCRSFGGYPVVGKLFKVVMDMGRHDSMHPNILFYGGHRYVPFTVENKTFWGRKNSAVLLCHFPG